MNRESFKALFRKNVDVALHCAALEIPNVKLAGPVIELHGCGVSGQRPSFDEAADRLFIDDKRFFQIIDVGLKPIESKTPILFVRVSAHPPSDSEHTWNTPRGNGPFKVIEAKKIQIV
jgi:hypothetical protein